MAQAAASVHMLQPERMRSFQGKLRGSTVIVLCLILALAVGCGSEGGSSNGQGEARQQVVREERAAERRQERRLRRIEARERRQARLQRAVEAREEREAEESEEAEAEPVSECDPNYSGACLDPYASDYDCEGGSGDGPLYTGPVTVVGEDPYELDDDGDGSACEWS